MAMYARGPRRLEANRERIRLRLKISRESRRSKMAVRRFMLDRHFRKFGVR